MHDAGLNTANTGDDAWLNKAKQNGIKQRVEAVLAKETARAR